MSAIVNYQLVETAYRIDKSIKDLMTKACYTESFSDGEIIRIERALAMISRQRGLQTSNLP